MKLENINEIKLFKDQPEITEEHILELTERGLLVPDQTYADEHRQKYNEKNREQGEVVGYTLLSNAIKKGKVSQGDARRLLVLETARTTGWPRQTVVNRLMSLAFAEDKKLVARNIQLESKRLWELNQK